MKKAWIIFHVLFLSLLPTLPAGAADSTAFNPIPISITATAVSVPVGTILPWPSASLPPVEGGEQKWAECNGVSLLQAGYPDLFTQIGTAYGGGAATFRLPDLRGEFIRGLDSGRGIDAGRTIGSWQDYEIGSHRHNNGVSEISHPWGSLGMIYGTTTEDLPGLANHQNAYNPGPSPVIAQGLTSYTGDTSNRPRNVAMMYVIRTLP